VKSAARSLIEGFMKLISIKLVIWLVVALAGLSTAGYVFWQVSPWPAALMIRHTMNKAGPAQSLEKYLPSNIAGQYNENYQVGEADALLDAFYPAEVAATDRILPAIIWIHGGAWLAGSKNQISGYLKILAGRGYAVIGIDFSWAPAANYPVQLKQVNAALDYIIRNAARLHVDPARIFLAGDSSGAQIAAQFAAMISAFAYAKEVGIAPSISRIQVRGILLYCGLYDFKIMPIAGGIRSSLWSYIGYRGFINGPELDQISVARHVTADFPPTFISVGNADYLEPQSISFAETLEKLGVSVDRVFFASDHRPQVPHEFQFYLETLAAQVALERSIAFLKDYAK
jgi:acetyl esterase